jgi:hypothetical protein
MIAVDKLCAKHAWFKEFLKHLTYTIMSTNTLAPKRAFYRK